MNQFSFIHDYIDKTIDKFNPELFTRSDDEIIEQLVKIILSCQINAIYTVQVTGFEVIDDYEKIHDTLKDYFETSQKTRTSRASSRGIKEYNRYNFIDLKNSDVRLLVVNYHIATKGESDDCKVIIAVPKVVNKFYFYLNGNYYSTIFQIVDSSTYNNSASKSKSQCVTLKTNLQPIRVYRNTYTITSTQGEDVQVTEYDCNVFSKTVPVAYYMFAKYGLSEGMSHLEVGNAITLSTYDRSQEDPDLYTFQCMKPGSIYVNVPKILFENAVVQHVVYVLVNYTDAYVTYPMIFGRDYWIGKLGAAFSLSNKYVKGLNVINSIEGIYDINIKEQLRLPWHHKKDIYCILRWIIQEYGLLRQKDNMDITTKRLRFAEYIAVMYATKLSKGLYRLSNQGNRINIKSIKKVIYINPLYLLTAIVKDPLVSFRNSVADMDSLTPIKFTYKGVSGIGEKSSSIPDQFRLLDISNIGILDPDASSPSDPGISGTLVPLMRPYNDGYFTDENESVTWEDNYAKLYDRYKEAKGLIEVLSFKKDVLDDNSITNEDLQYSDATLSLIERINKIVAANALQSNNMIEMMEHYNEQVQDKAEEEVVEEGDDDNGE